MAKDVIKNYKEKLSEHYCFGVRNTYDAGVLNLKTAMRINRTLHEFGRMFKRLILG